MSQSWWSLDKKNLAWVSKVFNSCNASSYFFGFVQKQIEKWTAKKKNIVEKSEESVEDSESEERKSSKKIKLLSDPMEFQGKMAGKQMKN